VKRLALITAAACLVFAGTAAARVGGPNDGTLVVKDGIGIFQISARGAALGHIGAGYVQIKDPNPNDNINPIVTGADAQYDINAKTTRYAGKDIRFRMIGGAFMITVVASGVDLSVVGKGDVRIVGRGTDDDGSYSVNGGTAQPVPFLPVTFKLTAPPPGQNNGG
jgi:hypothetical protein